MLESINPFSDFNRLHSVLTEKGFVPDFHPDSENGVMYAKGETRVYIDGDCASCFGFCEKNDVPLKEMIKAIKKYH
jgi:hypothetical protein